MAREIPSSHPLLSYTDGIAVAWQDFLLLVGRVMLGWIFMQSGWRKLNDMPAFIKSSLADRGVPFPDFVGYIAAPAEFIGGVAVLLGLGTRYAALLLLLFTILASATAHRYWEFSGQQFRAQQTQFFKNLSMMGGLLLLFVTAAGRFSVDRVLSRRR